MKKVIIVHGWEGSPSINWFPWLKSELESLGIQTVIPEMPDSMHPIQTVWVEHLSSVVEQVTDELYFVGHSLGGIAILRYLESLSDNVKVGGILLTASFPESIGYGELESFFQTSLNYEKIAKIAAQITVIQSTNDPFVPIHMGELLKNNLGAKLVVIQDGGHFNTGAGFTTFPKVLNELEQMFK